MAEVVYTNSAFEGSETVEENNKSKPNGNVSKHDLENGKSVEIIDYKPNGKVPELTNLEPKRGTWGKSIEFLMSCIAMNVGFGNIWRFPFVAYENGGGAFLILYLLVLVVVGRPLYYLEMCLGQFCSRGNVKMFESLAPALKGIGYGQMIATFCVATYLCVLTALTLFYLIHSFTGNLPWSECNPAWKNTTWLKDMECVASKDVSAGGNMTISSSELWFRIEALRETPDISNGIGLPDWRLALCLFVVWALLTLLLVKGIKSSGKSSYFLALFPYVILITMLVRSLTLEGAIKGIVYFVNPKWEMLLSAKVWYSAITQCLFSLNLSFGSVTMYASYNRFRHNCYRDAMIVASLDTLTSFMAGLIIFGILGNLSQKLGSDISEVINTGGTGLAFISYPEAVARFEAVPWLFSILFFSMLFVLGIGCLIALEGCPFTVVMDSFPHFKMWQVSSVTSAIGFLIGLAYITPGGQWIFTMIDYFQGAFIFLVLTMVSSMALAWWYGVDELCLDIEFMLKRKTGFYFRFCWGVLIPIIIVFVLFYFIATFETVKYEGKDYPFYIIVWGWILFLFTAFQVVIWFVVALISKQRKVGMSKALRVLFSHNNWGPKDPQLYMEWKQFKEEARQSRLSKERSWIQQKLCVLIGR